MINVQLIRNGKKEEYSLDFAYFQPLVAAIKEIPKDERSYVAQTCTWNLDAWALYRLMIHFAKRKKEMPEVEDIFFHFQTPKDREQFLKIVERHKAREAKKKADIAERMALDEYILNIKEHLEDYASTIDYSKYLKAGVVPYKFQTEGAFFMSQINTGILAMDLGTGKAAELDSQILTPIGYKRMGDIQVGDTIINSHGKESNVIGVFPQGKKNIVKITFSDNTSVRCCDEHLWTVQTSNHKKRNHGWFTYSVKELMDMGLYLAKGKYSKWNIPIVKPIEFSKKELLLHPYLLGCLLGDGGLSQKSIGFTSADDEIINNINKVLPENHSLNKNKAKYQFTFKSLRNDRLNVISNNIKSLGLVGTSHYKFIPEIYKLSSIEDRIELLQGLMDTDGTVDYKTRKSLHYTSVSRQLIDDLAFIVQSLGGTSKIRKQKIDKNGFKSWNCTISLNPDIQPFKLKRKLDAYIPKSKYLPYRKIRSIEYVGENDTQCIAVDAPDHLYLMDNCTVTHNTITALLACQMNEKIKKVLCIVPASLKLNWQDEVYKFTNEKAYVIKYEKGRLVNYRRNKGVKIEDAKYVILNYDYFNSAKFDFQGKIADIGLSECDTIIFDEAHKLGYKGSNTSKNLKFSFDKMIKRRILLTGTPVKNKLSQLFPLLKMVKGTEFSNEAKFFVEYCGLRFDLDYKQWVKDDDNEPKLEALNNRLNTLMYRVRKVDVLKDLPDMIKRKLFVEMTNKEANDYQSIVDGIKKYDIETDSLINLLPEDHREAIVIIGRLRQYTASLKVKEVYNLIRELNDDGEKVVIFDTFKKPLKELKKLLGDNSALYTGEQSIDERQLLVNKFQDPESGLQNLLISLAAGNAGITLTQAKNLILITESYVPSDNEQCYARIHRIGQKEGINIFICVVADTIDESIYNLVEQKQKMITKVIDNLDYDDDIQQSILNELIKEITGGRSDSN